MNDGWMLFLQGLIFIAGFITGVDSELASSAELVSLIIGGS